MSKSFSVRHKPLIKLFSVLLCLSIIFTGGTLNAFAETQKTDYTNFIVEELEEYRTEFSKTYLRNDGKLETIVSASPLHYKYFGLYTNIDNTLEFDEKDGVYKNKDAPFSVELPQSTNNKKEIVVSKDGYTVSLKLVGAKGVNSKKQEKVKTNKEKRKTMSAKEILNEDVVSVDKIEYSEIYDNTTIEYEVDSASLKENIILNKAPKKAVSYTYQIRAEGMQIEKRDNGSIWFYPEDDEEKVNPIFYIPIPFMYDSNDEYSYDIETNLEIKNKKATLTYTPSFEWLTDSNRAYPVTIDPTVTMHNGIHDGYVYSAEEKRDAILGFEDQLKVGKSAWLSDCDYFETYIKFDNLPEFPENYHLTSSSIMLTPKKSCGDWEEFIVGAYEITEDWQNVYTTALDSCLTYNNRPSASTTATSHAYFEFDFSGAPEAIDVTELTKAWYSGEKNNNGVKLSMVNETDNNWDSMIFHSSRNAARAPYLSVVFADTSIVNEKIEIIDIPRNSTLYVGNKYSIRTFEYPSQTITTNVEYISTNPAVATIDENGCITAIAEGTTQIFAIHNETRLTDSFTLFIDTAPIEYYDYKIPPNNTIKLGETVEITNNPYVTIGSRTPNIVLVDNNNGTVKGITVGKTAIEITKDGWDYMIDFELTVTADIDISDYVPSKIYTGENFTIYKPEFIGYQYEVNFITNDSNVAHFTSNADNTKFVLHATNPGTVNIVFQCQQLNLYEQITVTVLQTPVTLVDIDPNNVAKKSLYIGQTQPLRALVLPTDAHDDTLIWSCNNDCVKIEVNEQNTASVTIKANKEGKATISAFAADGSGNYDTFDITILKPKVTVTNKPTEDLAIGETYKLNLSATPYAKFDKWEVSDSSILEIDDNNQIIVKGAGTATVNLYTKNTITNKPPYITDSFKVTTVEPKIAITNRPSNHELAIGKTWQLGCSITPQRDKTIRWKSSNESIATISESGKITALATGTTTIRVSCKFGDEVISATFALSIYQPVTSISISNIPENNTLYVGQTHSLTATVNPTDAKYTDVKWESSEPSIITIDKNSGLCRVMGAGSVKISARNIKNPKLFDEIIITIEIPSVSITDYQVLSLEDQALMSAYQVLYAKYKSYNTKNGQYRMDEILREMDKIRNKPEYSGLYEFSTPNATPVYEEKTTKITIEKFKVLTFDDIQDMHQQDSIISLIASFLPGGAPISTLMNIMKSVEQDENIDFLGLSVDVLSQLLKGEKWRLLQEINYYFDMKDFIDIKEKNSYVKDGVRMVEGDVLAQIRITCDLGMDISVFQFVIRDNVPIAISPFGSRADVPTDGYYNSGYVNRIKNQWISEGYIEDEK